MEITDSHSAVYLMSYNGPQKKKNVVIVIDSLATPVFSLFMILQNSLLHYLL